MDRIAERAQRAIQEKVFPGCVIGIVKTNGERHILPFGHFTYEKDSSLVKEDTIYDLASVTKAIPGGVCLLKLIDEGKLGLEDRLVDYVPEFGNIENKKEVKIKHILSYTLDIDVPSMSSLKDKTADQITEIIMKAPLKSPPGAKYLYTNSTAFFISFIVKKITGKTLDVFADEYFFTPLKMNRTTFYPEKFDKHEIVPTEVDDWRGRVVQGEVHDESTFILREKYITSISGLFSTAPDILNFLEMLLNKGTLDGNKYLSEDIIAKATTNQIADIGGFDGLGFELNQPWFMGAHAGPHTFGKTGFTGTSFVGDIERGVACVILSNRIFPKRTSDRSLINKFRTDIGDILLPL